jgi:hypothetical protein
MVSSTNRNAISDEYFTAAMQLRLGVRHGPDAPACPGCGSAAFHDNLTHAIGCKTLKRTVLLKRHDGIAQALVRICQQNDLPVFVEPRLSEDRRKPDLDIVLGQNRFLLDVVVVNPADPSHAERSAKNAKTELEYRERAKVRKYRDIAAAQNAVVVPFACSAFGGLGDEALKFVQRLRDHLRLTEAERSAVQAAETAEDMIAALLRDIATAIARANGRACVELATRLASQRGAAARRRQRVEGDGAASSDDSEDDDHGGPESNEAAPAAAGHAAQPSQPSQAPGAVQPATGSAARSTAHHGAQVSMSLAPPAAHGSAVGPHQRPDDAAENPLPEARDSVLPAPIPRANGSVGDAPSLGVVSGRKDDQGSRGDNGGLRQMDLQHIRPSVRSYTRMDCGGPSAPYTAIRNERDSDRQRRAASSVRRRAALFDLDPPPCVLGHPRREAVQDQAMLARQQRLLRARGNGNRVDR